ncbi:MAG: exodeoxyribonuclease III [Chloroflexota bacterium]|nr:exodeoxyribonuclease III [Chloroflexota bacterium]
MRLATWNVNSLKARLDRVLQWIAAVEPDVVCMQETKLTDSAVPALAFRELGYEVAHHGLGQWNGVAIASRVGLEAVTGGLGPAPDGWTDDGGRLVAATCAGVRVVSIYVPNGRAVGTEFYAAKLEWLDRLERWLRESCDPRSQLALCGDFNVAPEDRDVWDPAAVHGATHVSPAERGAVARLRAWGLVDAVRRFHPEAGLYTWWDYRAGNFHKNFGMRIDHVYVTEPLAARAVAAERDREARKPSTYPGVPSDHAPLVVDFRD